MNLAQQSGIVLIGLALHTEPNPDKIAKTDVDLAVKDIQGQTHTPFQMADHRATILFFVTHDCPISNVFAPEIQRIHQDYHKAGVRCYLVYVDPDMTQAQIKAHVRDYSHEGYPAIFDKRHRLVKATGATVTPEAIVIGRDGLILYRGRINNLYADFGKRRRKATQHDLRQAMDEMIARKPIATSRTTAIGCYIPKR